MSLRHTLDRYYGTLRTWKLGYTVLNLFNRKKLRHAEAMYKKYGVKQSVLMPISSEQLPKTTTEAPWLDGPGAVEKMKAHPGFQRFDAATREAVLDALARGKLDVELIGLNRHDELGADGQIQQAPATEPHHERPLEGQDCRQQQRFGRCRVSTRRS